MRTKRLLGAIAAGTIAAIAPLSATIAAADDASGVGTATVSSTLLQIDVGAGGGVLHVRLLGDDGSSTIDPANGSPIASTSISPLRISSQTVPALNVEVPGATSTSSGAEDRQSVSPALPAAPAFAGTLAANLVSAVDAAGAHSGLDASLSNVSVAGGLLSVPSASAVLGTAAASGAATATRGVSIPSIEVLNLGAVLEAAGLALDDLPLETVLGLLAGLGIELPDVADPQAVVDALDDAIDSVQGLTGELTTDICNEVDALLGTVGGIAGVDATTEELTDALDETVDADVEDIVGDVVDDVPLLTKALPVSCDSVTGTVEQLIDDLQATLADVLGTLVATLDDTALLSVEGIEVGLVADAKSTVESSVADVTGTIGSVKVGALEVPGVSGLDLTAAADIISGASDSISAAVGSVLGLVNAQLAGLVDVDVLSITESVAKDGEYAEALASVTALTATIDPSALTGVLGAAAVDPTSSVANLMAQVGYAAPALSPVMAQLEAALGGLDLLASPTTITVGHLSSSSAFRPVSATVPGTGGELPRTGANAAVPAMAAVLVAGVALGIRRFIAAVTAA